MGNVSLLDCTLRDGGYVNDWYFGKGIMTSIYNRLVDAGVDIIELGFLDSRQKFDPNRSIQPSTEAYNEIYSSILRPGPLIVGMIDYGTCDIANIQKCEDTIFDGIRLIFKKPKANDAIEYAKLLIKKGYKVFLNMVSITSYSDIDILNFVDKANKIHPYAVSIVDTYGLMHREELIHYFDILDHNLEKNVVLGYHSHNNFQLAYSNCIEILSKHPGRNIVLDGTIYGMGKSAGNAPLELLAMHLNEYYGKVYRLDQILEAIDNNILNIYNEKHWGYSLQYYMAAMNDCHPQYVGYLLSKSTLSTQSIDEILKNISSDKKLNYDLEYIENLYYDYQNKKVNDQKDLERISSEFKEKTLLLLGPGKTIGLEKNKILSFIVERNPIVVSINMLPKQYSIDYLFISNSKRYNLIYDEIDKWGGRIISTSNITHIKNPFDYVISYDRLTEKNDPAVFDNALVLILNLLSDIPTGRIYLAGFDGYQQNPELNYDDDRMIMAMHKSNSDTNPVIARIIKEHKEKKEIIFLTESLYEKNE